MFYGLTENNYLALKNGNQIEEKILLQKLKQGDEMAFEILFYRYRGKVGNFIKRSIPPQLDLEEIVDEVFLRIWINKEKLDSNGLFGPYLFKIARNLVIDVLRKNINRSVYLHDNDVVRADLSINEADAGIEEKELESWFKAVLNQLPQKRKDIFLMSRFEDLSYKEIAKKLNISENTVDTQIRRALLFLKSEFNKFRTFFF